MNADVQEVYLQDKYHPTDYSRDYARRPTLKKKTNTLFKKALKAVRQEQK